MEGISHVSVGTELTQAEFEALAAHVLASGTSFPATPAEMDMFYRTDEHITYYYNGTAWVDLRSMAAHTAVLNAHTYNRLEKLRVGSYFTNTFGDLKWQTSPTTLTADRLYATPFVVARKMTFDRLAVRITTASADYVTGTASFTNGSTAVVGTDTTWVAGHVGRKIRLDADGTFYVIASVTDATHLTLAIVFAGATAAGAYTIRAYVRLGIYNSAASGVPSSKVVDAGEISVASTGLIAADISQQLAGGLYWLAIVTNGVPATYRYYLDPTPMGLDGNLNWLCGVYVAHGYGALPDPFGAATVSAVDIPLLFLRVASLD